MGDWTTTTPSHNQCNPSSHVVSDPHPALQTRNSSPTRGCCPTLATPCAELWPRRPKGQRPASRQTPTPDLPRFSLCLPPPTFQRHLLSSPSIHLTTCHMWVGTNHSFFQLFWYICAFWHFTSPFALCHPSSPEDPTNPVPLNFSHTGWTCFRRATLLRPVGQAAPLPLRYTEPPYVPALFRAFGP